MSAETVLWMPVFAALLCLVADASMVFGRKAEVLRIVQDANRAMSVGRFRAPDETETYISTRIAGFSASATVETTVAAGVIRTVVTMPASELTADLPFQFLGALTVQVVSEHMSEA